MTADHGLPPSARPRVAAGALFMDDRGRVLLVKPTYKDGWDIPGGYVEPGETPREACRREVREELGLDVVPGPLLVVDWAPSEQEGDKLLFVFASTPLTRQQGDEINLQASELERWGFHDAGDLDQLMPSRLARRLHAAIAAAGAKTTEYLEHGRSAG